MSKGWLTLLIITLGLQIILSISRMIETESLIAECEKNLPRTQHCVVIEKAIVKEGEG